MFLGQMQQLSSIIDDNRDKMSDTDYLQMCNLMKDIYNSHSETNSDIDNIVEVSYSHAKAFRYFLNTLVIISNISTVTILFIFMNKMQK